MEPALKRFSLCSTCRQLYSPQAQFCPRDGTKLEPHQDILAGKFILGKELGSGSMGVVYEAEQPAMERKVAVKLLHAERTRDQKMVERFEREARAAGKINHPNVVTIYESGRTEDGQIYIAMEYLEGESLAGLLQRERRLAPERALSIFVPVVRAMAAAHHEGVVHRDLKPDNIFIARRHGGEGLEEQVKVLDFGIAKLQTARHVGTADGTILGTLLYMAPEQLDGRPAEPCSDVYALGLILIEMLSGRLPWGPKGGALQEVAYLLRLTQAPLPLSVLCPTLSVPRQWQQLLDELLALDMGSRPAHAGEVLQRVKPLLALAPPPWPEIPAPEEVTSAFAYDATSVNIGLSLPEPEPEPEPPRVEGSETVPTPRLGSAVSPPAGVQAVPVKGAVLSQDTPQQLSSPREERTVATRETGGSTTRRRWMIGGIAGGMAGIVMLLALWRHEARDAILIAPADMAHPATSPDLAAAAQTSDRSPPPPVVALRDKTEPPPVQVWFRPKVPKSIKIECTGKHPLNCSAQSGCKVMLPAKWKCAASAGRVYLSRGYKHSDFGKNPEIDVELTPAPISF